MGLAAREIEAAGLATAVLSNMPDVTASVGVPRLVGVSAPGARPIGAPGDARGQRAVLRGALAALKSLDTAGGRLDLDIEGPPRSQRGHPEEPPPIVGLLKKRPWLLPRFVAGNIPEGSHGDLRSR